MGELTTMGSNIMPMNAFGIEYRSAVSSIDATTANIRYIKMWRD